jgi:HAD superfamily hydrolase (TIGR01509 family)
MADMVQPHGLALSAAAALDAFRGRKLADCVMEMEAQLGRKLPEGFIAEFRQRQAEALERELVAVEGVADALAALLVPTCVASNATREKVRLSLGLTGLLEHFGDRIFSAYDVGAFKPDPGLYLHAAEAMGVLPERCAVVEDSVAGARAGIAAGMRVLGYAADPVLRALLAAEGAEVFSRMRDLPPLLGRS